MASKSGGLFFGLFLLSVVSVNVRAQRFNPSNLSFGSIPTFTTTTLPATLENLGPFAMTIESITVPSGFSQTNNCNGQVASNSSCMMTVTFAPTQQNTFSGGIFVSLKSTNGTTQNAEVTMSGTGGTPIARLYQSQVRSRGGNLRTAPIE